MKGNWAKDPLNGGISLENFGPWAGISMEEI